LDIAGSPKRHSARIKQLFVRAQKSRRRPFRAREMPNAPIALSKLKAIQFALRKSAKTYSKYIQLSINLRQLQSR